MNIKTPSARMLALAKRAGSLDYDVARVGQKQLAEAVTTPLRQGVLKGDLTGDIFERTYFQPGQAVEYPLDFLAPGTEQDHVAYTVAGMGRIPERYVEGDMLTLSTYEVASSIDFALRYLRDSRWDVIRRALQVLEGGFIRKKNTDAFRVLLASGVGRNLVVFDDQASAGLFTKRVVANLQNIMRRYSGGNSTSVNRGKLSRLYASPEGIQDIRSWDLDQVDDITRREIFISEDYSLLSIFGTQLRDLDELGEGQEFQNYFEDVLGGVLPVDKKELLIGLDLMNTGAFYHPIREEVTVYEDPNFHRARRAGFYAWGEHSWTCLDGRRVLLGAF